jgi:hypothetical protein
LIARKYSHKPKPGKCPKRMAEENFFKNAESSSRDNRNIYNEFLISTHEEYYNKTIED